MGLGISVSCVSIILLSVPGLALELVCSTLCQMALQVGWIGMRRSDLLMADGAIYYHPPAAAQDVVGGTKPLILQISYPSAAVHDMTDGSNR